MKDNKKQDKYGRGPNVKFGWQVRRKEGSEFRDIYVDGVFMRVHETESAKMDGLIWLIIGPSL